MSKKLVSVTILLFVITSTFPIAFRIHMSQAVGTIYIRADGSIEPSTGNIGSIDNITYTFTETIYHEIIVMKDNIVLDGDGHTLQGMGKGCGIRLTSVFNVTIKDVEIKRFDYGIYLFESLNNSISRNYVAYTRYALYLIVSSHNTISGNKMAYNEYGVYVSESSSNHLYYNSLDNNLYGFHVKGTEFGHYLHSLDTSNLVNGKPVYYLISQQDITINNSTHPQIGFLALINSTGIKIEDLTLTNNSQGLTLAYTNNSKISNNNILTNFEGILLYNSYNNTVRQNRITSNSKGFHLTESDNNKILGNNIKTNKYGMYLDTSSNNLISKNNMSTNEYGIELHSPNNSIYLNNFVNNLFHAKLYTSTNLWDNGFEGNYWSGLNTTDSNHDGINDIQYEIDIENIDYCPLAGMFYSYDSILTAQIDVISNSTIVDFNFFDYDNTIVMTISNSSTTQSFGFCRFCISKNLISLPYAVLIDDGSTEVLYNTILSENNTHVWIYFAYESSSTNKVSIMQEFLKLESFSSITSLQSIRRNLNLSVELSLIL